MLTCLKVHVTTFVSVVSRFCCVHFLTFVSNSPMFQRTIHGSKAWKTSSLSFPSFQGFAGFLSAKL